MSAAWYAIVAISISLVALVVAIKSYRRKTGVLVRGSFSIASSRDCHDQYVSRIILENIKDRAITIFNIYLRVGNNYYIEIENLIDQPLLLKPFESYRKDYGPIQFYGINMCRIDLNPLLADTKVRKRLVVSTSEGKYIVPSTIRVWSPIGDFFRNHMTAIVRPVKAVCKGKYIGGNIKYVIEFVGKNGQSGIVPVHLEDYHLKMFRTFSLTRESLMSLKALNDYLTEQQRNGKLICQSFTVHNVDTWHERAKEFYTGDIIRATYS